MRFASWYLLILFALLPYLYRQWERRKPAALPHPDAGKKLNGEVRVPAWKLRFPIVLRLAALCFLVIALMRPQQGFMADTSNRYGVDIMVCQDVSSSMTAEDFQPNRISAALQVLSDFIGSRPNDRIGLIVFGSESYLQCPLTTDHRTLLSLLSDVKVGMAEDGTAIGMALANAVKRLKDSSAKNKLIFLLTDGDNNAGAIDPETAAKLAATYGIRIYAIGIGNPQGAPIPVIDPFGRKTYAANPDGTLFLTKMNAEGLKKIADITSGGYYMASDNGKLSAIFSEIDRLEKSKFEAKSPFVYDERYSTFALTALLLLLAEIFAARSWGEVVP
ncbi:MAG TPA: VWA domain-containing protein [Candidatus Omnitrophota bacterium]|nr:VWA domain-containing protein [Candidatus Omnitrophota bacterium]